MVIDISTSASQTQLSRVEAVLNQLSSVLRYARLPLLFDSCGLLPTWEAVLRANSNAAAVERALSSFASVEGRDDATRRFPILKAFEAPPAASLTVYMSTNASTRDVKRVQAYLGAEAGVSSIRYLDRQHVFAKYLKTFPGNADASRALAARDLSAEFDVWLRVGADEPSIGRSVRHMAGVAEVVTADPSLVNSTVSLAAIQRVHSRCTPRSVVRSP
jgi:FtsX extracellular domain